MARDVAIIESDGRLSNENRVLPKIVFASSQVSRRRAVEKTREVMRSKLRNLDLNLLVTFSALIEDRNVTRVAVRLGSTQSTVSQALARLRVALGDELFVRGPDGMSPTPFAQSLARPVRDALSTIDVALEGSRRFDPLDTERTFVIAINNQAAVVLAPRLAMAAAAAAAAARVTLDMRPSGTLDIAERLDNGAIDLAIGGFVAAGERFRDHHLYDDDFVVLCRKDHRAAASAVVPIECFAASPHFALSSTGDDYSFVDDALADIGRRRHIALHAPLLAAREILAGSSMIAVVARRTAQVIADESLVVRELPFPSFRLEARLLWHRRWDQDAGHLWLRDLALASVSTQS